MMDAKEKNWLFSIFPNEGFVDLLMPGTIICSTM